MIQKEEILQLALIKKLHQIPVVDDDGKVIGIQQIDELLKPKIKTNKVVLMVGGGIALADDAAENFVLMYSTTAVSIGTPVSTIFGESLEGVVGVAAGGGEVVGDNGIGVLRGWRPCR